jgi:hypothetical protein
MHINLFDLMTLTAQNRVTPGPARNNDQFDLAAAKGKVGGAAQIIRRLLLPQSGQ